VGVKITVGTTTFFGGMVKISSMLNLGLIVPEIVRTNLL
jgi:hypothetical protein